MKAPLTHSLAAKTFGVLLLAALVFLFSVSSCVTIEAYEYGLYTEGVVDYYGTQACFSEMWSDICSIYSSFRYGESLSNYYTDLEGSNLRFAAWDPVSDCYLYNDPGLLEALILQTSQETDADETAYLEVTDFSSPEDYEQYLQNQFRLSRKPAAQPDLPERSSDGLLLGCLVQEELDGCRFLAGVVSPPTVRDAYLRGYLSFRQIYRLRTLAPILLVICAFAAAADLIFLCCAAGHRRGREDIVLNVQDRIPLDLYLCIMGFTLTMLAVLALELTNSDGGLPVFLLMSGVLTLCAMLALAMLLTLCTRFKRGKWWRCSLIWQCGSLCCRLCSRTVRAIRSLWQSVRLTWRVAAICLGVALLEVLLAESRETFFLLVLNLGLTLVLCSLARQMLELRQAGQALACGDFDSPIDLCRLHGELREHGENLSSLGQGLSLAVEQRMRSERLKTELITNVSHDIKTPLTSIVNYVDLLQKDPTEEEQAQYLAVLDRQAKRLKKLTEDLVEASKASTGNLSCTLVPTNLREILDQALGEYEERLRAAGLEPIVTLPEEPLSVLADGRLLWRVLDNLLNNACKYAQSGTRLYLDAIRQEDRAVLTVKNISRQQLNLSPDELMERFVRGDSSRNTEGSGLGLNIAKSLVELQKGDFSLSIDGDLFKARIVLPLCQPVPEELPHD